MKRTTMVRSSTTRLFSRCLVTALAALLFLIFSPGTAQAQCGADEKECYGDCIHLSDVCCPTIVCEYGSICCDNGLCGVPPNFSCEGETRCEATPLPAGDCPSITACCNQVRCWYEANGETFDCAAREDCSQAGLDVVNYCIDPYGGSGNSSSGYDYDDDDDDDGPGPPSCSVAGGGPLGTLSLVALIALATLPFTRRRRGRRNRQ